MQNKSLGKEYGREYMPDAMVMEELSAAIVASEVAQVKVDLYLDEAIRRGLIEDWPTRKRDA